MRPWSWNRPTPLAITVWPIAVQTAPTPDRVLLRLESLVIAGDRGCRIDTAHGGITRADALAGLRSGRSEQTYRRAIDELVANTRAHEEHRLRSDT